MARLEIIGDRKLSGQIKIAGNKNSVLPIMAASLLTQKTCVLENVPDISDVAIMVHLLQICGAKVQRNGSSLKITAKNLKEAQFPSQLTAKLRASILLLAPILARVGKIQIGYPGGDVIGRRPLDSHIQVLSALGVEFDAQKKYLSATSRGLKGAEIFLQEASVTATENALIAASCAGGTTIIKRAAAEPHVVDLCEFLVKMGAKIEGIGTSTLTIIGVDRLNGANHSVRPDHIEVGTFAILAAATGSKVKISPIIKEDLDMILLVLSQFGVNFKIETDCLIVENSRLRAVEKVVTDVWPGFPTDLMPPMIVLATKAQGVTILHDWMYESRMFFVDKLLSMGAKVDIADPHRVFVYGPSKLHGQKLDTPDIRAGIALVIAALAAKGKSQIDKAELIERGYENIVERLTALGAKIKRTP
ncbi:UDP-N-acetylglucosamine 1-carboxyvinyltransferase [Candidatus Curtissbacteria bacterium RIFCSPLOWO2_01_FULL_42_26]|uniref:UDP-N-acetylglucosamine 1-carboxyvinyltransferase n=1 Tax=Candidatus Curtissbacteria bacterium RIFCSPLOWO2_01_FULL_42_26 TaxID=1797729 RepID=A0A1F5I4A7_9BACT|nr:MAG: UDP-N-acetylglucosamine 1-carboxyvinyltransferase [Candidatus Curtissbacteria bacterium RIFCSPLOWO2_01_FULL_42_26]